MLVQVWVISGAVTVMWDPEGSIVFQEPGQSPQNPEALDIVCVCVRRPEGHVCSTCSSFIESLPKVWCLQNCLRCGPAT